MTLPLAIVLFAALMIYVGIKGKSLRSAILGHSIAGSTGSVAGA